GALTANARAGDDAGHTPLRAWRHPDWAAGSCPGVSVITGRRHVRASSSTSRSRAGYGPNGTAVPRSAAGDLAAAPTSSPRSATDARLAPPRTGLAPTTGIAAYRRPDRELDPAADVVLQWKAHIRTLAAPSHSRIR